MSERRLMLLHYVTGLGILITGAVHIWVVFFTVPLDQTIWETTMLFDDHPFAILSVYRNALLASTLWLLLIFTTFHAMNGIRVIIMELIPDERVTRAAKWLLIALGVFLVVYGTRTILIAHSIR
jgi:succinate dehydrogenase hydrophobic anchor subunit